MAQNAVDEIENMPDSPVAREDLGAGGTSRGAGARSPFFWKVLLLSVAVIWGYSFTTMKDAWLLNSAFRSMAWGGLQGKSGVFQPFGKIKNCAFRYNDFSGMALNGFDWTGAELQQCTFDDTRLAGASFYGVRLGGTRFTRCDLQKADLRTAEEYAIDLETNKLKGARFSFPDVVRLLDGTGIVIE